METEFERLAIEGFLQVPTRWGLQKNGNKSCRAITSDLSIVSPLAGDSKRMETLTYLLLVKKFSGPHSLGTPKEWKRDVDVFEDVGCLSPHSLGTPKEWKLKRKLCLPMLRRRCQVPTRWGLQKNGNTGKLTSNSRCR